jgi:23S rRNA (guanosine2251-2'-O)-methyltransferase
MAGNSRRRGAKRKAGTKKGMVVGSGGQRRKSLEGKGPTPRAEERPGHPRARRAGTARRAAPTSRTGGRGRQTERGRPGSAETVAGRNAVVEALRARVPVKALYVAERIDVDDRVREVLKIAADRRLPLLEVPRPELDRITGGAVHQGLALTVPPYDYAHPDDLVTAARDAGEQPLIVAVDGVTDPRNLGAVVRSAAAFGAHGVVVPERRSASMTAGAWKTSAGAAARVRVAKATNLARQLRSYADAGLFVVGLAGSGDVDLSDVEAAAEPLCIVVGSEDSGLSRVVEQSCDLVVRIPMANDVESLNAGVAAGIALYEIARARRS